MESRRSRQPDGHSLVSDRPCPGRGFQAATVLLLGLYPIFGQILPTSIGISAFFLGSVLVLFWFVGNRAWEHISLGVFSIIWSSFGIYVLASQLLVAREFSLHATVFVATVFIAMMISSARLNTGLILTLLTSLFLVHALATIAFYISPALFDSVIGVRFFQNASVIDYRSALTSNAGFNAMYCSLGFIITAARLFYDQIGAGAKRVLYIEVAIFGGALLLTAKRAHPIYALLAVFLIYLLSRKTAKWFRLFVTTAVGVALISWLSGVNKGLASSVDRFLGTFEAADLNDATSGRTFLWAEALRGWQDAKIIGNGWGSFYVEWPNGRTVSVIAHNEILNILYEGGLVGLLLFLFSALIAFSTSLRTTMTLLQIGAPAKPVVAAAACVAIQGFLLLYGSTTGELLAKPYTFMPYLFSIGMAYSVRADYLRPVWAPKGQHVGLREGS